jgi:5'-deoxynucleotidase
LKANEIIRTGHTKRWTIVNTRRQQTLAEHLAQVALFTMRICDGFDLLPLNRMQAVEYALLHDLEEVYSGDIPTPYKRDNEIPPFKVPITEYVWNRKPQNIMLRLIVKLADIIEALIFISEEGVGTHAEEVRVKMLGILDDHLGICSDLYPQSAWHDTAQAILAEAGIK